jgi:hypothetical protein
MWAHCQTEAALVLPYQAARALHPHAALYYLQDSRSFALPASLWVAHYLSQTPAVEW